jgi:archaeal chaperonin
LRGSGDEAWRQNIDLAVISAFNIESCLGPSGAYKMVSYSRGPEHLVKVTKDAVEVLSELQVQYPAVKTIAEAARIHREQAGDGVSTLIIIIAGLLQEARRLLAKGVHPTAVINGYREATKAALASIDDVSHVIGWGRTPRRRFLTSMGKHGATTTSSLAER